MRDTDIAERLRRTRQRRGRSQRGFAEDIGMPLPSYRDYEGGKRVPGGEALRRFARAGVDTHWLLTGEASPAAAVGEAAGDYDARMERRGPDTGRLREILTLVETELEKTGRHPAPAQKADLIAALYELYTESGEPPDATAVQRLLPTTSYSSYSS